MFIKIKKLLGFKTVDISALIKNGATVLDVRTPQEFSQGHLPGSHNIPLQNIAKQLKKIEAMPQPIITCCASGIRSGRARRILKKAGLEVYNVGAWTSIKQS